MSGGDAGGGRDDGAHDAVRDTVREGYAKIARGTGALPLFQSALPTVALPAASAASGCCGPSEAAGGGSGGQGGCCSVPADPAALAAALGYSREELESLPEGTNLGLSCGNPQAIAALREGETVLDLGAGAGFDLFLVSKRVGARGRAIGVDMTAEMVRRARGNLAGWQRKTGLANVEFRLGEIEHLPVADASVDVVISNCVLNLSPDKPQVWREIARVLKPGGRVVVSDLALEQRLPAAVLAMVDALVGCVSGAALVEECAAWARAAGLVDVELTRKRDYLATLESMGDPLYAEITRQLPAGRTAKDYVTSLLIAARKPPAASGRR
ncbi:MAG: arsenite methyltransferase [Planctomycetes bacterium]|nr:arsenite methyltransferase [Planctomycetota bacterium]